jgi:hypothetical protein
VLGSLALALLMTAIPSGVSSNIWTQSRKCTRVKGSRKRKTLKFMEMTLY